MVRYAPPALQGSTGSEDCLYLNVWVPAGQGPFPVLAWIHGGGNSGGGTQGQSGASYAKAGIVCVTLAYRLGALGFLELGDVLGPDYADSGDNGILDLVAALRWLQENVSAFDGDPKRIAVAGQSAGAKDIAALMALPSAKGLFARAVMESGGGQTVHTRESAREATDGLLAALGVEKEPRRLLDLPAETILEGQRKLEATYPHDFPFRPFVGGKTLPKRPVELVDGSVPLILGTCRDESLAMFAASNADAPIGPREVANVPFPKATEMEARYRAAFPAASNLERRIRLLTAEEYWIPSVRFAEAHAARGGKTWMYRFDHATAGHAVHGSELAYTWSAHPGWSMHETWVAFVKGEEPKGWPQYDPARRRVRVYGQEGAETVVEDPRGDERKLWDGVL